MLGLLGLTYSAVARLWNVEVDDNRLDCAPDDEDDICLPSDLLHGDGPSKLVD
jgi:hypothetical protein